MALFERRASLLRTLVDETHWKPDEARRRLHRVGYMDEGSLTAAFVDTIRRITQAKGRAHSNFFDWRVSKARSSRECKRVRSFSR